MVVVVDDDDAYLEKYTDYWREREKEKSSKMYFIWSQEKDENYSDEMILFIWKASVTYSEICSSIDF